MADLRISELPALASADAEANDDLAIADYSASETKRLTLKGAIQQGVTLIDNGVIPGAKLVADSVTATQIAPDAITASELAGNAVDTAAIQDLAVTDAKVASGIDGAKLIADSVTATQIAPNAITASELADDAVDTAAIQDAAVTDAKVASGIDGAKLTDGTVTDAKLASGIDGAKLIADSVTAAQIAPDAITASELANGAVDTAAIQDLAVTDAKIAAGVDGAKLTDDTVTAAKISVGSLDRGLDKTSGAIGHTNAVTAGTSAGISYDAQGHVTGAASLVPSDLPIATTTAIGGVSIPTNSGLTVSGVGAVEHETTLPAGTASGITFSETGHITATTALTGSDLPAATAVELGAVSVPGPALEVSGAGELTHADSGVTASTYTKVTVDAQGHVTAGAPLAPEDIPNLDTSKITTGTFDSAFIADRSVTLAKLADYSISYIQEAIPPLTGNHIGTFWYQESTAGLHMWNGNSWMPVSIGRLSQENLRYCGTIDASTGLITGVTTFGTAAGYIIGDALKNATDQLTGTYFVIDVAGSGILQPNVVGDTFDVGDWVLCNGAAAGYVRIDTLSGGGGGVSRLNDLLDVTLTTPADGQMFVYTSSGQWVNTSEVVGGTY